MTTEFERELNKINTPWIRDIIETEFKDSIDAAQAGRRLEKKLNDAIDNLNETNKNIFDELRRLREQQESFEKWFKNDYAKSKQVDKH